ncbi:PepSY domain-containing protein [Rhizobium ruizarguesonis]|uniref:PepSY domain-containing protein n=1 Tax=Rhizobium ruizarguesonis TaxID=2081791 RepID=UPI001FDF4D71|nr:PepSY domain-containing protein [Rhizobium ruizarguesonis]
MIFFIGFSPSSQERFCSSGRLRTYAARPDGDLIAIVSLLSPSVGYSPAMYPTRTLAFVCLVLLWPSLPVANAHADDFPGRSREADDLPSHEDLPKQVHEGKILPLTVLKAKVLAKSPGELIDISVDRHDDRIIYEFRILRGGGQVTEVEVDAASGRIVEIENE